MTRRENLELAKAALGIAEAWRDLGLPGEPAKTCRVPWREDRKPSFSIFDGGRRWKDHSTGESGDVVDFVARAKGLSVKDAIDWVRERTGINHLDPPPPGRPSQPVGRNLQLPELSAGGPAERQLVADARRIRPYAVEVAAELGVLRFGEVCGYPCWVLVDEGRIAEARRLDGQPFPAVGSLGERKAHTLAGSCKSWPLGASLLREQASVAVLLVEGGPDYLAAFHFLVKRKRIGLVPVAMLGRSNRIAAEALGLFHDRRVRICPHDDPDGGGLDAARRWAAQLAGVGAKVDAFTFDGLRRQDGKPVSDLNDAALIHPEDEPKLEDLLP